MIRCSKKKSINFFAKNGLIRADYDKVYVISGEITFVKKYRVMCVKKRFIVSVKSLFIWFLRIESEAALPVEDSRVINAPWTESIHED